MSKEVWYRPKQSGPEVRPGCYINNHGDHVRVLGDLPEGRWHVAIAGRNESWSTARVQAELTWIGCKPEAPAPWRGRPTVRYDESKSFRRHTVLDALIWIVLLFAGGMFWYAIAAGIF